MIFELVSLVRWEWFKLRYRWMPWILPGDSTPVDPTLHLGGLLRFP